MKSLTNVQSFPSITLLSAGSGGTTAEIGAYRGTERVQQAVSTINKTQMDGVFVCSMTASVALVLVWLVYFCSSVLVTVSFTNETAAAAAVGVCACVCMCVSREGGVINLHRLIGFLLSCKHSV